MNNKAKKPVLFLLCLTASIAALSACGKKTTRAVTTSPTVTTQTKTTQKIITEKKTTQKQTTKKDIVSGPKVYFIADGEIIKEVSYNEDTVAVKEPTIPEKSGYAAAWMPYTLNGKDIYVTAIYTKLNTKYKIEYYLENLEDDEYSIVSDATQEYDSTVNETIKPFIKDFEGFSCTNSDAGLTLVEDSTKNILKVYYDRDVINVKINYNNAKENKDINVKYGTILNEANPEKAGYNFINWTDKYSEEYDMSQEVTKPLELKANFTPKSGIKYTVNYYQENLYDDEFTKVTGDTQVYSGTTEQQVSVTPNESKYQYFVFDAELSNTSGNILGDGSLELNLYYKRVTHHVIIDKDNGDPVVELDVKHGTLYGDIIDSTDPVKPGYIYNCWAVDYKWQISMDDTVWNRETQRVVAIYTARNDVTYTINYYQENLDDDKFSLYDTIVEVDEPTQYIIADTSNDRYEGFVFDRGNENNVTTGHVVGDGSLVLNVYYKRKRYEVRYDKNQLDVDLPYKVTVKYGARLVEPSVRIAGYTILGFSSTNEENNLFDFNTKFDDDAPTWLYLMFEPNDDVLYKINYYEENIENDEYTLIDTKYLYGETDDYVCDEKETPNGFGIEYNLSNTDGYILGDGSLELNVYYKRYTAKIHFCDNNDNIIYTLEKVKYGTPLEDPKDRIVPAGYTFSEYFSTYYGPADSFSEINTAEYAAEYSISVRYTANENTKYTVKVYLENIVEDDEYTLYDTVELYGETDSAINPKTIPGFTFYSASGYTEDDDLYIKGDGSTVIKAYYKRERYTINFNTQKDGEELSSITNVKYGSKLNEPIIERTGYHLVGWTDHNSNPFDFNSSTIDGNNTLNAVWEPNTDTLFTVIHHYENANDDDYTDLVETFRKTTDDELNYEAFVKYDKNIFTITSYTSSTIKVNADGSTVLEITYSRNQVVVNFYSNELFITANNVNRRYKIGETIHLNYTFNNYLGYEIAGLYIKGTDTLISNEINYDYIVTEEINLYANVRVIDALKNFNFYSDTEKVVVTGYIGEVPSRLVIPESVDEIEDSAFFNYHSIRELVLNDKLTKIGTNSFSDCINLETITLNDNTHLEFIGEQSFYDTNIKSFIIPNTVKHIGASAFNNLNMDVFVIPNSVTEIGYNAFDGCIFKELKFEENTGLRVIPHESFKNCKIDKVTIPSVITEIEYNAFESSYLKELVFEDNSDLEVIGTSAFSNCNLKNIELPNRLKQIKASAFYGNYYTSYVKTNANLLEISDNAFALTYTSVIFNYSDLTITAGEYEHGEIARYAYKVFNKEENDKILFDKDRGYIYYINGDEKELLAYLGNEKNIYIPSGVTKIGNSVFCDNKEINSVTIPDTVTTIGENAFFGCTNLYSVNIGSGVTEILADAFNSCSYLIEVNNKSIIELTKGATENGYVAYHAISLTTDNDFISKMSIDNMFIRFDNEDEVYLIKYLDDNALEVIISDDYTIIFKNSFVDKTINHVIIGKNVHTIGENAFGNTFIDEISFDSESNLKYIYSQAFSGCLNLESIIIPKSVLEIRDGAFQCPDLKTLVFEEESMLNKLGNNVITSSKITELVLPDSLEMIDEYAFSQAILQKVTFGANLVEIGSYAFSECRNLKEIIYTSDTLEIIRDYAFTGCMNLREFELTPNVGIIYDYAFYDAPIYSIYNRSTLELEIGSYENGCIALNALEIYTDIANKESYIEDDFIYLEKTNEDDSVDLYLVGYIGNEEEIIISKDVTIIDKNALAFNNTVTTISFENGSKLREIEEFAFYQSRVSNITLPSSIEKVGAFALESETGLNLSEYNGAYYIKDENDNYIYLKAITNYNTFVENGIADTCRIIGQSVFNGANYFTEIVIPESVVYIGFEAFANSIIENITLPSGLKEISDHMFDNCDSLISITLPDGIEVIGEYAFANCNYLETINIPACIKEIRYSAFAYCNSLGEIDLSLCNNLKLIGNYAFDKCYSIDEIYIPSSVTYIGEYAFNDCTSLETVVIENNSNLKTIGLRAFYNCNLSSFSFDLLTKLESIGSEAFIGNHLTGTIIIPSSVKYIYGYAFASISTIDSLEFMDGSLLEYIGKEAFYDCSITNLDFSMCTKLEVIDEEAFYSNDGLNTIIFNEGLKTIGASAFASECYYSDDSYIVLPSSIEKIGYHAFYESHWNKIFINGTIADYLNTTFGNDWLYAFTNDLYIKDENGNVTINGIKYSKLTTLVVPDGTTIIPSNAFRLSKSIESVIIPSSLMEIGEYAFYYTSVEAIYYMGTEEEYQALINNTHNGNDIIINSDVYYYSEEEPDDPYSGVEYWRYYKGMPMDYYHYHANYTFDILVDEIDYYLFGASMGKEDCLNHVGSDASTNIQQISEEGYNLSYEALMYILEADGKNEALEMLQDYANLISFIAEYKYEDNAIHYDLDSNSNISGYDLVLDEDGNLVLDVK